ncbi:unnamed protein product [Lactuca saligna]|uniref:Uncharacterized protein n=1 Tax=Lactuca saligna TaxID=75948 RepID=A0AA35VDX4_LACSI|nr:unnamed protein product [Lactuca saligna]
MNTYNVDINIINREEASFTDYKLNPAIPPEGPTTKSNMGEDRSSDIPGNLSNKDSNVNMGILQQTITTFFSSQSIEPKMNDEEEERVDLFGIKFDSKEENVEDQAIMFGMQYKILNLKLDTILQFINDIVGLSSSVSKDDVELLLNLKIPRRSF